MVSLWPWKGADNSPASFEKTLSTLSTKITQMTARLDSNRQQARRFKALWTLYSIFIYLLYSVIDVLVLGWESWGILEYGAVVGGPFVVYGVRAVGSKYFEYRISNTQRHLDSLNKQRDETIEKLKIATKYDSTQQLLDKYGGESPKSKSGTGSKRKDAASKSNTPQMTGGRTGIPPPSTANIVRPPNTSGPSTPVRSPLGNEPDRHDAFGHQQMSHTPLPHPPSLNEPGFAPNAFPAPPQYNDSPRWYDRFMDVLLGEDESLPKNRLALICQNCRLINGQAPPGMKNLEELGRWRCGGCGAWNGEESEAKKVLAKIKNQSSGTDGAWESVSKHVEEELSSAGAVTDDGVIVENEMKDSESEEDANEIQEVPETDSESEKNPPRRSKRGRSKGNKKGETD